MLFYVTVLMNQSTKEEACWVRNESKGMEEGRALPLLTSPYKGEVLT